MKKNLIIILAIVGANICFANDSSNVSELTQIENQIDSLKNEIESIKTNSYNKEIINEYKHLNSLFEWGFGILLGLFGLVFPLIIYIIQIKPSLETIKETKKLIKKLDDDFEKSFENHLKRNRDHLIDKAIDNLLKKNTPLISNSLSLLESYENGGFTELQVVKLLKLIKTNIDDNTKHFIAKILTFQEDINIEDYFREIIIKNPKEEICTWGAIYFATYNKTQYIDLIAQIVINGYSITSMVSSLCSISKDFAIIFLNNALLVDQLDENELINYVNYGFKDFIEKTSKQDAESTLLWKKYQILKSKNPAKDNL
ncbi:MAG: hypothetical protein IMY72_05920 [Bacteroidetes bacterium]|nr:hypothetical protein [Bacteroidota bacterium]